MTRPFLPHVITDDSALGGSVIQKSVRFDSQDGQIFYRTSGTSTSQYKFTYSVWVKLNRTVQATTDYGELLNGYDGNNNNSGFGAIYFYNGDLRFAGWSTTYRATERKFRDPRTWYHIIVAVDSTLGTADNRQKIYINGVEETNFSTSNNLGQNDTFGISNNSAAIRIGRDNDASSSRRFDGYMAEVNFIDGQQLDASYFGYTESQTNIWRPKRYTGTYGTNGFYLDFSDSTSEATMGIDRSPNGNDLTGGNLGLSAGEGMDSFTTHTPTSENEFAQFNVALPKASGCQYRAGGYTYYMTNSGNHMRTQSNMPVNSGKWYAEFTLAAYSSQSGSAPYIGVNADDLFQNSWTGEAGTAYQSGGSIWRDSSQIESGYASYAAGDVISVAMNLDSDPPQVWWAKNGTYIRHATANPATGAYGVNIEPTSKTGYYNFAMSLWASTGQWDANFGQRDFAHSVPAGFKTLCTDNVRSTQSIPEPQKHFDILTWTGNATNRLITGLEFKPDFVWIKNRSDNYHHGLFDVVRGSNKVLKSSDTVAEGSFTEQLMSFNDGGFTLGDNSDSGNYANINGDNYVAWCWKGGGPASSNTDGDVTSQVSVNQEAGFSLVQFEAQSTNIDITVGHGLGKKPAFWMWKSMDANIAWYMYHQSMSSTPHEAWINFNSGAATTGNGAAWRNAPTSSVFTHGSGLIGQQTIQMYMWAEIPGYSKFGVYRGSGTESGADSADGQFVFTGFRPALVIVKNRDAAGYNWVMQDDKRGGFNPLKNKLYPDASSAENTSSDPIDIYSNGFKPVASDAGVNAANSYYIYMAWADQTTLTSFKQSNVNAY